MDLIDAVKIGLLASVIGTFLVAVLQMDDGNRNAATATSTGVETASS
ncbi:hypothetical protein [Rubellimicrobium rubrum]|nr:hypothetical protein [Rubellimicrobium rubrum]